MAEYPFAAKIEPLPIFCYYDKQRFTQFGSMDCANWYGVQADSGKLGQAMYPAMGRAHISFLNQNKLIFTEEPLNIFKTIDYFYVLVGTRILRYDIFYNERFIGDVPLGVVIWEAFLTVGTKVFVMLTDGTDIYIITEDGNSSNFEVVTDVNRPVNPTYVAAFGSRFVVSSAGSNIFTLTTINLAGGASSCFTINGGPLFASASGVVGQFAVLHGQLYIFNDYTTDIWANIATQITVGGFTTSFPWKLNTSYNWDYGIADPLSLSVDFGRMVWLAKNTGGIVTFMVSDGQAPKDLDTQAINILLEEVAGSDTLSPFLTGESDGFLYQYENTIFYRAVAGQFMDFGELDIEDSANAIEYNFSTGTWARVIELNGERNRIQKHIYFNNKHLVIVQQDFAIYQMAGNIYTNELLNPNRTSDQAIDAFIAYPMRYELVTKQIYNKDYSEFKDEWVEIDFVFGDQTFYRSDAPFANTVFIIAEDASPPPPIGGNPIYLITEDGSFIIAEGTNTPTIQDNHYNILFKPHIELYYSDDGGVTFITADNREFSPLGQYRWRMRWYELDASRNRCYKLICVSPSPIVILGAIRKTMNISGGAELSVALDRVNSAPIINDDFSYEFKQWCSNTVDTLNEVIGDIEEDLISRETIASNVTSFNADVNSLYIPTGAVLTSIQLPATTADDIGSIIEVAGQGSGGWRLLVAAGQTIEVASVPATASFSVASATRYDAISIILVTDTKWITRSSQTTGFVIV